MNKVQQAKIIKIRTLTVFLGGLEDTVKSEILSQETRNQCQLIIKSVMAKLNEISEE